MKSQHLVKERIGHFIFGGNALFTVKDTTSGRRFTYKVKESRDKTVYFVRVLTGSDNDNPGHYHYMGIVSKAKRDFYRTEKSQVTETAPSLHFFKTLFQQMKTGTVPSTIEVWHEGRCARCGRVLTVPESIETGFGPECASLMNKKYAEKKAKAAPVKKVVEIPKSVMPAVAGKEAIFTEPSTYMDMRHGLKTLDSGKYLSEDDDYSGEEYSGCMKHIEYFFADISRNLVVWGNFGSDIYLKTLRCVYKVNHSTNPEYKGILEITKVSRNVMRAGKKWCTWINGGSLGLTLSAENLGIEKETKMLINQ